MPLEGREGRPFNALSECPNNGFSSGAGMDGYSVWEGGVELIKKENSFCGFGRV